MAKLHQFLRLRRYCSSATAATSAIQSAPQATEELSVLVSDLVLAHRGDAPSLARALARRFPEWPAPLVDRVLKRLWDDAPRALLFFEALLRHLPAFRPTPSSLDHALDLAARLREARAVDRLLGLRARLGLAPTPRTFAILFERHVLTGKPDRAVRLFLSMRRRGCPPDLRSFNSLLDALCKSRHVEQAASLLRALKHRFRADAVSYSIIADGWCRIKRTPKALEVLREMVESGLEPTLPTYNILLNGFFKAGQVKEGWEFFAQMKKRGRKEGSCCQPDVVSYTTVVHGLGLAGQIDKARCVFNEMISNGCLPSVATYNALIQVLCKKDSVDNAISVFGEMVRKGYTPNSVTYNLVIRGLCHAAQMHRAMEFMEQMKHDGCEPNVQTYNILIRYLCDEGEIEKGLELFEKMGRPGGCVPNLDTYNVIISAMFVRKRSEDMLVAGRMVLEMVERGHFPRKFMFNRILNGLLLTGNQVFVKELLRLQERYGRLPQAVRL